MTLQIHKVQVCTSPSAHFLIAIYLPIKKFRVRTLNSLGVMLQTNCILKITLQIDKGVLGTLSPICYRFTYEDSGQYFLGLWKRALDTRFKS